MFALYHFPNYANRNRNLVNFVVQLGFSVTCIIIIRGIKADRFNTPGIDKGQLSKVIGKRLEGFNIILAYIKLEAGF